VPPFVRFARNHQSRYPFRSMSHSPTRATLHELPGRSVLNWPGPALHITHSCSHCCSISLYCWAHGLAAESFPIPKSVDELTASALRAESAIYQHPVSLDQGLRIREIGGVVNASGVLKPFPTIPCLTRHICIRRGCVLRSNMFTLLQMGRCSVGNLIAFISQLPA